MPEDRNADAADADVRPQSLAEPGQTEAGDEVGTEASSNWLCADVLSGADRRSMTQRCLGRSSLRELNCRTGRQNVTNHA